MAFTGLTPTINMLAPYTRCFFKFGSGSLKDSGIAGLTAAYTTAGQLQRNGLQVAKQAAASFVNAGNPGLTSQIINVFVYAIPNGNYPPTNTQTFIGDTDAAAKGWWLYGNTTTRELRAQVRDTTGAANTHLGAAGVKWNPQEPIVFSAQIKGNNADGINIYKNGVKVGVTIDMTGKTIDFYNNALIFGNSGANNRWCDGTYKAAIITEGIALTEAQHLLIYDELVNQIRYETHSMICNHLFPTLGGDVYRACYGILAGELTMSAGQSIGQLDALKVSTGTHKMNTFLYNGQLAKGIKCVTGPGNIILPDPRPDLGTTWAYRYYDDSAATWESRTSATATVALDAANDIILWSTADNNTCLRKY